MKKILLLVTFVNLVYSVTIVDTVNFTLKNSEKLHISELESKISEKQIVKKKSKFLPSLDIYLNSKNTKQKIDDEEEYIHDKNSGADLKLNVFNGFKDFSDVKAAESEYNAKRELFYHEQNKMALEAIKAHLNIVYQNRLYKIELENIKEDKELLAISKSISKVIGDTTPTIEVKTDLDYAKSAASEVFKDVGSSLFEYKMITHKSFKADEFSWPKSDDRLLTDIYNKIKEKNNLIKNYTYEFEKLKYEIQNKKGEFLPYVDVTGNYNRKGIRSENDNEKSLKVELRYNIFNGFYNKAEIQEKQLEKMKILFQQKEAIKKIIKDTDTVKHTSKVYKSLIEQNKDTLKSLLNLRSLYIKQFSIGKRQISDIIDLQKKIVNIKKDLVKNEYSLKLNYFYILSYTGELVQFVTTNPIFKKEDSLTSTDIKYSFSDNKEKQHKKKDNSKKITKITRKAKKIEKSKTTTKVNKKILKKKEATKRKVYVFEDKPILSNRYKSYKKAKRVQKTIKGSSIIMLENGLFEVRR